VVLQREAPEALEVDGAAGFPPVTGLPVNRADLRHVRAEEGVGIFVACKLHSLGDRVAVVYVEVSTFSTTGLV